MDQAPEWFSGNDIKECLKNEDLIPVMEEALASFSCSDDHDIVQPVRTVIQIERLDG